MFCTARRARADPDAELVSAEPYKKMTETDQQAAFDAEVRRYVYEHVMTEGAVPPSAACAAALSCSTDEVGAAFRRLADARVLVLQEGGGEILMAAPFSAVPTPFVVRSGARSYYAPCAWDALGVPVVLGRDAEVEASCGCCGTRMSLRVEGGALVEGEPPGGVVHFALPAARWWENVVFT